MVDSTLLWLRRQADEFSLNWDDFSQKIGIAGTLDSSEQPETFQESAEAQWPACASCAPRFTEITAIASVGLRLLSGWAARQRPPRWVDRSLPAGEWLFEVPPRAQAQDHELGLHLGVSLFAELATPTDDNATAVDIRHHEILDLMVGQFAHFNLYKSEVAAPCPVAVPQTSTAPRPGARPTKGKQTKKTRKKH